VAPQTERRASHAVVSPPGPAAAGVAAGGRGSWTVHRGADGRAVGASAAEEAGCVEGDGLAGAVAAKTAR
jgi:hypothetical protein